MRKFWFVYLCVFLIAFTVITSVVLAQLQQPFKLKSIFVASIPGQDIAQDQSILNPVPPGGGDFTC